MQQPDTQPGAYYVTTRDGRRTAFLMGPYIDDHAQALAMVDGARRKACELDPRAHWYEYGTSRLPNDGSIDLPVGKLNDLEILES